MGSCEALRDTCMKTWNDDFICGHLYSRCLNSTELFLNAYLCYISRDYEECMVQVIREATGHG
ncbi:MAG: hypothetical protein F7B59_08345 [Desulfurococcales archaeon]|nr:hypothetical protein [Desulfurococcales archaeon]